jgi:ribonuclease P protein component
VAELGKNRRKRTNTKVRSPERVRHTLGRADILRGRNNFQLVFKQGRKFEGTYLRCLLLADDRLKFRGGAHKAVGFTAPGSLKRAVDRNRLKRLAREAYRLNKEIILPRMESSPRPLALIFVYSTKVAHSPQFPTFSEIEQDMKKILQSVAQARLEGDK